MSTTYSAADIVDKTLTARVRVSVYRDATDTAVSYATVAAGQPVGIVYSYLNPAPGRSRLWWQFRDGSGLFYYAPQKEGLYDISELRKQGVITVDEKIRQEQEAAELAAMPWWEVLIKKYGIYVLGTAIALKVLPQIIDKSFNNRR